MRVRLRRHELLALIAKSGLSQNHWAIKLGLSKGHWSEIVNGKHPFPSPRTRRLLLEAFDVTFEVLFEIESGPSGAATADVQAAIADRYLIEKEIREGGMGTVYLARDMKLGRLVAVKIVSAEAVAGIGSEQFLKEIRIAARLQHYCILPLHDAGVAAGAPYYVMPFIPDGALRDRLQRDRILTVETTLRMARQMAIGLQHAHDHHVLHCDVKPENVLMIGDQPLMADFGIAQAIHTEAFEWEKRADIDSSAGTPAYVSPEQASGERNLDARSDVYSLACVIFEMLAGRAPFRGTTTLEIVSKRFHSVPALEQHAPHVPSIVSDVIRRAMAIQRADRPSSVIALVSELEAAARPKRFPVTEQLAVAGMRVTRRVGTAVTALVPGLPRIWEGARQIVGQDLRFIVRSLMRQPTFTLIAVATLGLGIGANTAMFSAVRYALLDPLAVDAPEELTLVYWVRPATANVRNLNSSSYNDPATGANLHSNYSYRIYKELQTTVRRAGVDLTGYTFVREMSAVVNDQPPLVASGLLTDGRYFTVLRPGMALGRPLTERDDRPGAPPVAVLSHSFWRRAFGGDPAIIGRTFRVNGAPLEVVGVTEPAFRGISRGGFFPHTDVTLPLAAQPLVTPAWEPQTGTLFTSSEVFWIRLLARVPDSIPRSVIEQTMSGTLGAFLPPDAEISPATPLIRLRPGARGEQSVRSEGDRLLWLLTGVAAIVLLIACMNLAGLMLARGVARQREIAVRRAIGASRIRLVRHVLLESTVLAFIGAAAGLALTFGSGALLNQLVTAGLGSFGFNAPSMDIRLDAKLLVVTATVASIAAISFGLWPALRLTCVDPGVFLKHHAVGAATPKLTLGRALIALQIAVSVPLVIGAFLFLRTISNLGNVPLGFDPNGVAVFRLNPEYANIPSEQRPQLYVDVLREIAAVPGVLSATLIENPLMSGWVSNNRIKVADTETSILMNAVGPTFFETLGMEIVAGRAPGPADGPTAPHVAVVNEAAVQQLFAGRSPIGRHVQVGSRDVEIIGVVGDSRYHDQRAGVQPILFDAALQRAGFGGHHVVLRTREPPARLVSTIRRTVARVDPDLPVPDLQTQASLIELAAARERLFSQLLTLFGGFVTVLACIGIHGVTAYSVDRRTNEIGVRVALGAQPRQVVWLVLRQVLFLAGAGLVIGIPLAIAVGPTAESLLFGVSPTDPVIILCAAVGILAVALAGAAFPARRASTYDPLEALRVE